MIRFIDLDKQKVFDGSQPYVFYMDDSVSTGKWSSKSLLMVSDADELEISFPKDSMFSLVDMTDSEDVIVNGHNYTDLESIKTQTVTLTEPTVMDNYKIFKAYIVFMSDAEGEVHDLMTVSDGNEEQQFEFAADVYSEDERLSIDLSNFGMELPNQFQKAVYETNVRDESDDYVLLNRKWKELVIEYWNVLANKGSYKSLINSLKFFEYGDLVKISEYWRYTDQFGADLMVSRYIEQLLDDDIRKYLDSLTKTTYIGLNMSLCKTEDGRYMAYPNGTENLDTDKFIPEPVPEVEYNILKWTVDDLALKMTLLANYFSTFFMPIHLDLIHSSVDRLVFTSCLKVLRGVRMRREDHFDDTEPITCSLSERSDYWIADTRAFNYPETVLRNDNTPDHWGDMIFVGVDPRIENLITPSENITDYKRFLNQYFGGVGVCVPVETRFRKTSAFVKQTNISIYKNLEDATYSLYKKYTSYQPVYDDHSEFNLLFVKAGKYLVQLQYVFADGSTRTGSWYINIHGTVGNSISLYRMRKIDWTDVEDSKMFDDWFYDNLDFNDFMFTQPFADQIHYKQWLYRTDGTEVNGIGTNQMLLIDCGTLTVSGNASRTSFVLRDGLGNIFPYTNITFDETLPDYIIARLQNDHPHYWWKYLKRNPAHVDSEGTLVIDDTQERYYIVGVRKYFDTDEADETTVYEGLFNAYDDDTPLENVIVKYNRTSGPVGRGYITVTAPVGTEMLLNGVCEIVTDTMTTTIPVTKEQNTLSIDFKIANHAFHKDLVIDGMRTDKGSPEYILHCDKETGYVTMETSRFFPIFHRIEPIDTDTPLKRSETIVCIPDLSWTDKHVDNTYWEFVNATTGEIIVSESVEGNETNGKKLAIQEPFVGRYDYRNSLTRGYYDIVLHYSMGGTEQTETVLSAFKME